jgi:hypothetical protein
VAGELGAVVSTATGALVAGMLVAEAAVGAETVAGVGVGDPQAAVNNPLTSTINNAEVFFLVNISLPFWLDETGKWYSRQMRGF